MACGGCGGGKKQQVVSQQVHTQQMQMTPRTPVPQRTLIAPTHSGGVRAQPQKRCSKCSWPMNSMRRYDTATGRQIQVYACMNRKCLNKEEIK
jgi:hypothetical protein